MTHLFADILRTRRTIHRFAPQPVDEAPLMAALESAVMAPNHRLTQPWRFYLLGADTREAICRLNGDIVRTRRGDQAAESKIERWRAVPGWLLVTRVRVDDPLVDRENDAACACAVQNLMLHLWSEGIGTKWTTGPVTRHPDFPKLVGFDPALEEVVSLLWYGMPHETPTAPPRRLLADVVQRRP